MLDVNSDASVARFQGEFDERGYGWWAVEVTATGGFVGFAGLDRVDDGLPFSGVEVGWRLARSAWGHGLPPKPPWRAWPSGSRPSHCPRSSR
ncbi:RimJ/RimL family protein N-acetyltransferase [Kitasatospora sp. MAA4]|nr:RimJ/RimL family protein N-acetyltransferase [Kitasatospora sp. MAA4]